MTEIVDFTTQLRSINGLYLFKIFAKYTAIRDIHSLFNFLAQRESEEDLRKLEKLWENFIKTGSIHGKNKVGEIYHS